MRVNPSSRVSVAPDVTAQILEGEAVLLDLGSGRYFGLDAASTRMWDVITGRGSIERACVELVEEFDVQPQRLERDLCEFVERLAEYGLVELRDE